VLNILLEQKQTARFITRKLYRYLVNEEKAPEDRIELLATRFYDSGYDIMALLDAIFTSDWFYDTENMGVKIKSPVELWAGIRRTLPLTLGNPDAQVLLQKALGQVLFFPPGVAGWPGGRQWIDSSSLMLRLRIPQLLLQEGDLDVRTKDDDDTAMGRSDTDPALSGRRRKLQAQVDWQPVLSRFSKTTPENLLSDLSQYLWQIPNAQAPRSVLEKHTLRDTRDDQIKTTIIQLMATPEYQLC
jgi:uncharacterized protein (DUF1800 family)